MMNKPEKPCNVFNEWKEVAQKQEEVLDNLHKLLAIYTKEESKITKKEELITLNQAGYTFDDLDIPYNALVVADVDGGTLIDIDYKGLRYSIHLEAGVNQVNLVDGSVLKTQSGVVVGLVRTQHPFKF